MLMREINKKMTRRVIEEIKTKLERILIRYINNGKTVNGRDKQGHEGEW